MFSSLKTYAQDNELLDKVWYLYKLNVNGTKVDYPLIESLNGKESTIEFLDNSIIQFSGCPSFSYCTIEYEVSDNQTFIFQSLGCLDMDLCENFRYYYPDYEIFEDLLAEFYYSILPSADTSSLQNLSYTINVENNYFNLKLINENQDVAYYSTENLSTPDFEILNSSIYPNPVQDQLFIRLEDFSTAVDIKIYDLQGRVIQSFQANQKETPLDVSNYHPGMYFIKLTNSSNQQKTMKFIKQ